MRAGGASGLDRLGMRCMEAGGGEQNGAHRCRGPKRNGCRGNGRSRVSPDTAPTRPPERRRDCRRPCRFRTPDHPSAVSDRVCGCRRASAQDVFAQFRRERSQRQQTGQDSRAQRALSMTAAGLALLHMPANQVTCLLTQLPIPVGQQFSDYRARLPPGERGPQRTERFI